MMRALPRAQNVLDDSEAVKGMVAGLIGGLAGSLAMTRVQQLWKTAGHQEEIDRHDTLASPIVHYAFGAAMGAMYGYYVETTRQSGLKSGAQFGMSVWAAADEIAIPALGLSGSAAQRPAELHAQSFASHVVFGVTTEVVRRGVRALLR